MSCFRMSFFSHRFHLLFFRGTACAEVVQLDGENFSRETLRFALSAGGIFRGLRLGQQKVVKANVFAAKQKVFKIWCVGVCWLIEVGFSGN